MKSKRAVINAATIVLLIFYFILIVGSTPIIARFFIFSDDEEQDNCFANTGADESQLNFVPSPRTENTTSEVSVDNHTQSSECGSKKRADTRLKLGLAIVIAVCLPCLLILLV